MNFKNVIEAFIQNARQFPDLPSIKEGDHCITYRELDAMTEKISHHLRAHEIISSELCFVVVRSKQAAVLATLGTMKAGKIFVPVNIDSADERIAELIREYNPAWIIVDDLGLEMLDRCYSLIQTCDFLICPIDLPASSVPTTLQARVAHFKNHDREQARDAVNLQDVKACYLYFTSGSTGLPKAILGSFLGLNHFIDWEINFLKLEPHPRVSQYTPISFDPYLRDIFVPLSLGGCICIPPMVGTAIDIIKQWSWIKSEGIHLIHCVPTLFKEILKTIDQRTVLTDLQWVLLAGEKLFGQDITPWFQKIYGQARLVNVYGPTETTLAKFAYVINPDKDLEGAVPVGMPIPGAKAIILDDNLKPCGVGIPGEIYIRTPYRTLGYYNNPTLTSEVFVNHPSLRDPNDLLYRTGDIAYVREDGNFVIQGRRDDQVKINGVRVELAEIEGELSSIQGIEAAIVAFEENNGLVLACVQTHVKLNEADIVGALSKRLPPYLIPSFFLFQSELATTHSGKINRRLVKQELVAESRKVKSIFVLPSNSFEEKILDVWTKSLKWERDAISVFDNFFTVGGNSLKATVVVSAIRKLFAVDLQIKDLFVHPTIQSLAKFVSGLKKDKIMQLGHRVRPSRIPLSYSQERLWFIDRLQGSVNYHVPVILRLMGDLDGMILEKSLQGIVDRHEILRTVYGETDGEAYQEVQSSSAWNLSRKKLRESELLFAIDEIVSAPFDLSKDYMLRGVLVEVDSSSHVLVLVTHHIATDGWSQGIFMDELVSQYEHHQQGKPLGPGLSYQYIDYALWQRDHLSGALLDEKLGYWTSKLSGIQPLDLPTDFSRPAIQSTRGSVYNFTISADLHSGLQSLSQSTGSTLFMTLLSAFKVLLYRYSGQYNISVGSPIAGRTQKELETMIGFFVNTLVLRSNLEGNPRFLDVLHSVKSTTLEAYDHQEVPFEKIVERVEQSRDMSRSPLFQVMFGLRNMPEAQLAPTADLKIVEYEKTHKYSKFDLTFSAEETIEGLSFTVEYCTDLFEVDTIVRLCNHYQSILLGVVASPSTRIDSLEMLTAEEKTMLVDKFNATSVLYPAGNTLLDLFYTQASLTPDAIAVRYEDRSISYRELDEKSNQLSHYLLKAGVRTESLVGICIERSIEMIIGLFGILKSGGAYVPVDPEYPVDRIEYMLSDSQVSLVLTSEKEWSLVKGTGADVICLDSDWSLIEAEPVEGCGIRVSDSDLAYVIYTSGSTGRPKGVMNEHRGVSNRLLWAQDFFRLKSMDRVLQKTSVSFDVSVWEIFWPLIVGAELVLARPGGQRDAVYLEHAIEQFGITTVHFVPSMLEAFLNLYRGSVSSLRRVLCSGEALATSQVALFFKNFQCVEMFNLYGPTEAAVDVSCWKVEPGAETLSSVPIGKPIANTRLYVLDSAGNVVPPGVIGELYIGGVQVARGYVNNPETTAQRFVTDPFSGDGKKLYKTGDVVRMQTSGDIDYIGRNDNQVKIRGNRIELQEIEAVILEHPSVSQCVVIARENGLREKELVGYFVPSGGFQLPDLVMLLRTKLPSFMVPSIWKELEFLPLTPSGKLDRKNLPDTSVESSPSDRFVAPRNEEEAILAAIWCDMLGVTTASVLDNFFTLGGHSLMILKMQLVVNDRFSMNLSLRDFFDLPTIEQLAQYIIYHRAKQPQKTTSVVFEI